MDFLSYCRIRVGNGMDTRFWLDNWIGDKPLYVMFPRLFALDLNKEISVAGKLHSPLHLSFRRSVRSGFEQQLMENLQSMIDSVSLSSSHDRWICNLSGDGDFRIKEVRNVIDDMFLPSYPEPTRWVNFVPIKINIFSWRARRNCLPSRANLLRRVVNIDSSMCPICMLYVEDVNHILLCCDFAQSVMRRICKWWDWQPWVYFQDWISWLVSNRLSSKLLKMLEGVFWVAWWSIWKFRNHTIFDVNPPRRSMIFDNIVSYSFNWCHSRCNRKFSWDDWLKNPHLITL